MSLLHADPVNLECVTMLDVIFAEATGVRGISSKIGSCNGKGQSHSGEKTKCGDNILTDRRTDTSHTTGTDVGPPPPHTIPTLTT